MTAPCNPRRRTGRSERRHLGFVMPAAPRTDSRKSPARKACPYTNRAPSQRTVSLFHPRVRQSSGRGRVLVLLNHCCRGTALSGAADNRPLDGHDRGREGPSQPVLAQVRCYDTGNVTARCRARKSSIYSKSLLVGIVRATFGGTQMPVTCWPQPFPDLRKATLT